MLQFMKQLMTAVISCHQLSYIRILKAGFRTGDKAPMAIVQLVDFESGEETITEAPKEETQEES